MPLRVRRGGRYERVADPGWEDPLDSSFAAVRGGRWNPPGSFPTLYLCGSRRVARANVERRFEGLPYGPADLDPAVAPILVEADVPETDVVDVVTDQGCLAVGLPASYPFDADGAVVGHDRCQPIGAELRAAGEPAIAARSAAPGMTARDEELAWFRFDGDRPSPGLTLPFSDWYWGEVR